MASNEKFCLRWNDFESNMSEAFQDIREEKDLFDCTLSCGTRQIQAHKLVLAACSPFFRTVLRQNPHQHPLLYLKGVEYSNLQSVLSFMYNGEVNVAQEELNSFLAVAEDLQVKGLTQNQTRSNTPVSTPSVSKSENADKSRPPKPNTHHAHPRVSSKSHQPIQPVVQEESVPNIKKEPDPQIVNYSTSFETQEQPSGTGMIEEYGAYDYEEQYEVENYDYESGQGVDVDKGKL